MQEYTLERTGRRPITFTGEEIASNSGEISAGKEQNRWHDLALYKTDTGKYVLHVQYLTRWQGELDKSDVFVADAPEELEDLLIVYNPLENIHGFPPQSHDAQNRQANLEAWITQRYNAQVSEILADLPEKI